MNAAHVRDALVAIAILTALAAVVLFVLRGCS